MEYGQLVKEMQTTTDSDPVVQQQGIIYEDKEMRMQGAMNSSALHDDCQSLLECVKKPK